MNNGYQIGLLISYVIYDVYINDTLYFTCIQVTIFYEMQQIHLNIISFKRLLGSDPNILRSLLK